MNKFNDYNTKVFGLHVKNDQLTILQGAIEAKNVISTTLGSVKSQIETLPLDPEMKLTSFNFSHNDYLQQFQ